jgi:hypothetical protein
VAGYVYYLTWKKVRQDSIEMRSSKLALTPLLMAERDREYVSGMINTILYHEFLNCENFCVPCMFRVFVVLKSCSSKF